MGFAAFDRASQADPAHRAGLAVCLGELQVGRQVRELQLRVLAAARQRVVQCRRLRGQQDQRAGHDLLPPGDRRGGVVADRAYPAGIRTVAATGDPVGAHDVRVARIDGQRLLPPVGRSARALGPVDLFHERSPYGLGLAASAAVIDVGQVCEPKVTKARHSGVARKWTLPVESSAAAGARKCRPIRARRARLQAEMLGKLGAANRTEAVARARELDLIG